MSVSGVYVGAAVPLEGSTSWEALAVLRGGSILRGREDAPGHRLAANGKTRFSVNRLVLILLPADCSHSHC